MFWTIFILLAVTAKARQFSITHLIVPKIVPPGQESVEIECRYDANFTLLNWFKGSKEFFRYRPGTTPSTRSFPTPGVGRIELLVCGPTACRLKLGGLTEEATGLYRCDIERDVPPYKFETRNASMEVHRHEHRRPLVEGLAKEFGEGDEMQAYCRAAPDAEIRWYINGREIEDFKGSNYLKKKSSPSLFFGIPRMVTLQCAEYRFGTLTGSNEEKALWKEFQSSTDERPQEQRNGAGVFRMVFSVIFMILILHCCIN